MPENLLFCPRRRDTLYIKYIKSRPAESPPGGSSSEKEDAQSRASQARMAWMILAATEGRPAGVMT